MDDSLNTRKLSERYHSPFFTVQAEDYDTRIAGPLKEREAEENGGADEAHQRVQRGGSDTEGRGDQRLAVWDKDTCVMLQLILRDNWTIDTS